MYEHESDVIYHSNGENLLYEVLANMIDMKYCSLTSDMEMKNFNKQQQSVRACLVHYLYI